MLTIKSCRLVYSLVVELLFFKSLLLCFSFDHYMYHSFLSGFSFGFVSSFVVLVLFSYISVFAMLDQAWLLSSFRLPSIWLILGGLAQSLYVHSCRRESNHDTPWSFVASWMSILLLLVIKNNKLNNRLKKFEQHEFLWYALWSNWVNSHIKMLYMTPQKIILLMTFHACLPQVMIGNGIDSNTVQTMNG